MEIDILHEPPKKLIKIIQEDYLELSTVKKILITAQHPELDTHETAAFDYKNGEIIINLSGCLTNKQFTNKGMMLIPAIWFNMLHAVFHEGKHARQLEEDPELAQSAELKDMLEKDADEYAIIKIIKWAEANKTIPDINKMGWAGEKIKEMINAFWAHQQYRDKHLEELEVIKYGAAAEIETWLLLTNKYIKNKEDQFDRSIIKDIDNGLLGLKINNKHYLKAFEFFEPIKHEMQKTKETAKQKDKAKKSAQN